MNDICIVEIFQRGRWKVPLNVQNTQSDRETDCTERDRTDEKNWEEKKNHTVETDGKGMQEEKMIKRGAEKNITDNVT